MSVQRVAEALCGAKRVVVAAHLRPDGDALGSSLAVLLALRALHIPGQRIRVLMPSDPGTTYAWLPGHEAVEVFADEAQAARLAPVDLLLALDCGDRQRLGPLQQLRHRLMVNIDHHASNDGFGDLNLVRPRAASTSQLIEPLLRALGVPLTPAIATCLYAGLLFDTGRFGHGNTGVGELRCAARLVAAGADPAWITRRLCAQRSQAELALIGLAIGRLEQDPDEPRLAGLAFDAADLAAYGRPGDWGEIIELARSLAGVEVAWLLREEEGEVRCSLRSEAPHDVGAVAACFGGGGHRQAAGCTLPSGLVSARRRILEALRQMLARR